MNPFQNISRQEWGKQAERDLKSREAYEALFRQWGDLSLGPYYSSEDRSTFAAQYAHHFGGGNPVTGEARFWYNITEVDASDHQNANSHALQDLMSGADGIHFINADGLPAHELLQDILPEYVHLSFEVNSCEVADGIRLFFDEEKFDHDSLRGYFNHTKSLSDENQIHCYRLFEHWKSFRTIHIDAPCDSDPVQSLTRAMKETDHMFSLLASDHSPTQIAENLIYTVPLTASYFEDILFLRALRILVYKIARGWGADINPDQLFIHSTSTPWSQEGYSKEANMIKSATAAMAGVLGGSQAITVSPTSRSETDIRIARNVSNMLKEESYFDKTRDPLAGAYFIESVTEQLARESWNQFQNTFHEA